MQVFVAVVLAMISVSCKSTSGSQHEMRAAAFAVPTFEEDGEREDDRGDNSAMTPSTKCEKDRLLAGECVQRARSAKNPQSFEAAQVR